MSVTSSEGIDFSKELEVPVTIAMPIPEGMDASRLVILHYRADGTEELITPRIENGKAIFAITHFSTFALAEKKVGGDEKGAVLKKEDGNFVCYVDGVRDDSYIGYADYDGSKFYVENGSIKTTLNGVMIDSNSNPLVWYFCSNGQVQTQHVGLAEYDGEWFYIENGKVATDMNAFVKYDGGLFAVGAGRIIGEYNGLMQDPQNPPTGDWYFFANGQAQTQYTGLAMYDGKWFYVVKGKLAVDYTGTIDYDGATFNVVGGMVQESATPATEPTKNPVTGDWKKAYLDYLTNDQTYSIDHYSTTISYTYNWKDIAKNNPEYMRGAFIYIDGDTIPEMVLSDAPNQLIVSYQNGKVQVFGEEEWRGSARFSNLVSYITKDGKFIFSGGGIGWYDELCSLSDGGFTILHKFDTVPPIDEDGDYIYYLDDEEWNGSEGEDPFGGDYDSSKAAEFNLPDMTYNEVISYLQ